MNSSAIVHISKPAGVKSGFYKCGHGMYPVDIESMDKIKIQPRDYSEKKITKTQSKGSIENCSCNVLITFFNIYTYFTSLSTLKPR